MKLSKLVTLTLVLAFSIAATAQAPNEDATLAEAISISFKEDVAFKNHSHKVSRSSHFYYYLNAEKTVFCELQTFILNPRQSGRYKSNVPLYLGAVRHIELPGYAYDIYRTKDVDWNTEYDIGRFSCQSKDKNGNFFYTNLSDILVKDVEKAMNAKIEVAPDKQVEIVIGPK